MSLEKSTSKLNIGRIIFLTFLITSTGFDVLSINIGGGNLRASYLFYLIVYLFIFKLVRLHNIQNIYIYLFILVGLISIIQSYNPLRSGMYLLWIIFSYIVIFGIFSFFTFKHPEDIYKCLFYSFRIQVIISLILSILGIGIYGRATILYYEPSYFAIASIIYLALVFTRIIRFGFKQSLLDILMLLIELYTTKSATLIIAAMTVLATSYLLSGFTIKKVFSLVSIVFILFSLSLFYAKVSNDLIATTLQQAYSSENPVLYLMDRGGNRIPRLQCAWDVFLDNSWLGVGIGGYESYTNTINISYCSAGKAWLSAEEQPATNIFVEILATTGIFGGIFFVAFLSHLIFMKSLKKLNYMQLSYLIAIISMLIMLNFEANYLRPYLWMILGIYSGSLMSGNKTHFNSPRKIRHIVNNRE